MTVTTLSDISFFFLVFYASLLLSLILVPLSKKFAVLLGVLDQPDHRKVHDTALPRMGGIGIAGAFLISVLLCVKLTPPITAFVLGGAIIVFTGLLDDIVSIPPKLKFTGQILAAVVFISSGGGHMENLGDLLGMGDLRLGPFSYAFTVFSMVGIMNAMNLSDGLDGLAGGMSAIATIYLGLLAYAHQAWLFFALALAVLGSIMGFLRHNTHPAKLFMGDTGSLFLGYALAALTMGLAHSGGIKPVIPAVILALPIVDTLWVMGQRAKRRTNPFRPDKTHLHHRLMRLGLRHVDTVTIIYGLMFLLGGLGWIGRDWPEYLLFLVASSTLAILYGGIAWCERQKIDLSQAVLLRIGRPAMAGRTRHYFARLTGRSTRVVFPVFLLLFFAPALFMCPPPHIIGYFALAALLFIVFLYPWSGGRKEMPMAHGVFFAATFFIVLLYWFNPDRPTWLFLYINILSAFALLWCIPKVFFSNHGRGLIPSSFELMLIVLVWFVPLVLAPAIGIAPAVQIKLAWACVQAVPILVLFKLSMRRHARRNRMVALGFLIMLSILGVSSFIS